MKRILSYIETRSGWQAWLLMLVAGALMTLTFAPFYYFPLLIPSLVVLFQQLDAAPTNRTAFWRGWAWGFGFFVSGIYWISLALLVDAEQFAWLIPFALFGLTGALAIFLGVMGYVYARWKPQSKAEKLLWFVCLFAMTEYARGHLFTGFPWNLVGYAAGAVTSLEQWASVFGAYGLSVTLVTWSVIWLCFKAKWQWVLWVLLPIAAITFQAMQGPAEKRLAGATARVVQGNIEQALKWDPRYKREIVERYQRLSAKPGLERVDVVIWPEATLPYAVAPDTMWLPELTSFLQKGQLLITGGTRTNDTEFWNSVLVLNYKGELVSYYDKHHLVPFGEYVPFSEYLPMEKIAPGFGEFSRGMQGTVLELDGLPIMAPLVCYEAIFSHYADSQSRAQLLLNLTNDAWFGESIGPYQHEAISRMRAIEQGLPLLRVANTGVSGYYDANGRVVHRTDLGQTTMFDVELSVPNNHNTLFAICGDAIFFTIVLICGFYRFLTRSIRGCDT